MDEQPQSTNKFKFLEAIPGMLSSNLSIFIFIFLFIYLVGFGIIGLFYEKLAPSASIQLVLGNYTNVTSALGAAIAAGASTHSLSQVRSMRRHHDELRQLIAALHEKVDKTSSKS